MKIDLSRSQMVRAALVALAHKLGPGGKLPTTRALCRSLRVSSSTLYPILQDLERQNTIVLEHGRGIYVAAGVRQKTIGVVFGADIFTEHFSPFWGLLLKAVREQTGSRDDLRAQAYMEILEGHDGLGGHAQLTADLEAGRIQGMLVFSPVSAAQIQPLADHGVPLVVASNCWPGWQVIFDYPVVIRQAARQLAARGCRRVACFHSNTNHDALLAAELRQAGVANPEVVDWVPDDGAGVATGQSPEKLAHALTQRMIAQAPQRPLPDAIVSLADDTMTRGAITAMFQAGLKPGRDLQIATITNTGSPVLDPYAADLIQIAMNPADTVRAMLTMLETLMTGGTPTVNPVLVPPLTRG